MNDVIKTNAKALILLALIALAGVADAVGVDVGLDAEHYVALLTADFLVWLTPNKKD
jgi:hypothetical protein